MCDDTGAGGCGDDDAAADAAWEAVSGTALVRWPRSFLLTDFPFRLFFVLFCACVTAPPALAVVLFRRCCRCRCHASIEPAGIVNTGGASHHTAADRRGQRVGQRAVRRVVEQTVLRLSGHGRRLVHGVPAHLHLRALHRALHHLLLRGG